MKEARLSHEEVKELLAAVALGSAPADEAAAVRAHLATCAECRADLATYADAAAGLGLSAPVAEAPGLSAVRARLLERIAAGAPAQRPLAGEARALPPLRRQGLAGWAAAAVILLAAAAVLAGTMRERGELRTRLASERDSARAEIARLTDSLRTTEQILGALTGPGVQVVNLAASGPRQPSGRMFWDQAAGRWTFVAHDLPALAPGRTYQLWVIDKAGARVSAGIFQPTAGRALVQATYPLPPDQLGAIAVTEEPEGGVPQPTGSIVIAGSPG